MKYRTRKYPRFTVQERRRLLLLFALLGVIFLSLWSVRSWYRIDRVRSHVAQARAQLEAKQQEHQTLETKRQWLKNPFYREKLVREQLSLAEDNEIVYKIIDD